MFITDQVNSFGLEKGVREFLKERKIKHEQLYAFSDVPENCPWYEHKDKAPSQAVKDIFEPVEDMLPETVSLLAKHCKAILCMYENETWYLLYVVKMWGSDYYLWVGRQPADSPHLNPEALDAGWQIPEALREFYMVHEGFGESDLVYGEITDQRMWHANCIRPASRLEPSAWEIEGEDGANYHPGQLLFFFHDGSEDYFGFLPDKENAAYYNQAEGYIEDSLAGDMFGLIDEYFSEMFL